jgi:Cu2+-exporting ATPase
MEVEFRRRFWVSLALSAPVLALGAPIPTWLTLRDRLAFPGDGLVQATFATVIYFYGGLPFLRGVRGELGRRQPGMMTLIALAITVSWGYSVLVALGLPGEVFFWELATLIDIMLLGHWIEMKSVLGASGALESLVRLLPGEAHLLGQDGSTQDVAVSQLKRGDRVLVKPGERVPVDGVVVRGQTSVNEAMLTGESQPVDKDEGATVVGGSVNGEGAVTVEVRKTGDETYLSQAMAMVRQAQESRSRSQDLADRAAVWLTGIALGGGAVTLVAWLAVGASVPFALARTVTVMVITCPHALGLAVPLVVAVSTALSAANGLLIRDRSAFERASALDAIVFDKTGTLTEGRLGVTEVIPIGGRTETDVLRLAAAWRASPSTR